MDNIEIKKNIGYNFKFNINVENDTNWTVENLEKVVAILLQLDGKRHNEIASFILGVIISEESEENMELAIEAFKRYKSLD